MSYIGTPLGPINKALALSFLGLSGLKYDKALKDWSIVSSKVRGWKVDHKTASEKKKWQRADIWIPIKMYNMQYALYQTKTVEEAISYVKDKMLDLNGDPLFLPDELARQNGLDPEDRPYNYCKILREMEEDKLRA